MKVLVLAAHIDGLTMPEGASLCAVAHEWRVSAERTTADPKGRPYCKLCGGKVNFYSLYEMSLPKALERVRRYGDLIVERDGENDKAS